ncbi:hypothetical protein H310_12778 [Aphanomyces invadans]|uniref:J domain-containing protein n=1 Tax=Aphanomyces invadans TaxID=157072 RepID=A0A024THV0_9STRA|nr:hypothetical protein H310_12778 [Aphanomyces invadans]ETV93171.1 hypothetical protein H310_12778 [Aphanomyces invadans]|eukprot:XP_008878193.1 hypothetical protein H310_12778 [Aphanomyces invadans]
MRCHYEVLGVERDASSGELRKAFHKLALKWHPDKVKEGQDVDEATQVFQEIQSAYEVVSDPHERAWYDDHREQILRGEDGAHHDGDADRFDIMRFFSTSVYKGFQDDERGFYSIYRGVFEEIDALDQAARGDPNSAPSFGTSASQVPHAFYDYWRSYMTDQTFSWLDQYKTTDAPTREIRRLMEKDNKKARDAGKKTFSANVRALADFVRKRDKRMIKHLQEKEAHKAAQQVEKAAAAAARKAAFAAKKAEFHATWEATESSQYATATLQAEEAKRRAKADAMVLVCELCKKEFKSEKQVQNHLVSKKHREQMILAGVDPTMLDELLALETADQAVPQRPASRARRDDDSDDDGVVQPRKQDVKAQLSPEDEAAKRLERQDKDRKAAEKRQERKDKRKTQKKSDAASSSTTTTAPAPLSKGAVKGKAAKAATDADEFPCGSCSMTFPTLKMLQKHVKKERHEMP